MICVISIPYCKFLLLQITLIYLQILYVQIYRSS